MIKYFDSYRKLGWEIVPLLSHSKIPFFKDWNKEYDCKSIREFISKNPDCNLGLRLGKIIDVEADNYYSNYFLNKLTRNCKHPTYVSERSIHHLFLSPDKNLTKKIIYGIEFRGKLHQSVLPPSVAKSGFHYRWTYICKIPPMPQCLIELYFHKRKKKIRQIQPWCSVCREQKTINENRYYKELNKFKDNGKKWVCADCI